MELEIVQIIQELSTEGGSSRVAWELARAFGSAGVKNTAVTSTLGEPVGGNTKIRRVAAWLSHIPTRGALRHLGRAIVIPFFTIAATFAIWRRRSDAAVLSHGDSLSGDAVVVHAINAENLSQKRLAGDWQWTLNLLHLWVWLRDSWMIHGLRFKIFVAVSARVSADLQRLYGVPVSRIRIIPNGIDVERFQADPIAGQAIRKEFGIPDDAKLIVFVGHEFRRKGLAPAIAAFERLGGNARMLVVGSDNPAPYRNASVGDRLIFAGARYDMTEIYSAADVFVLPTSYETFSLVCMEAMACSVPVLATRVGGIEDYLEDGVNGYAITEEPDDIAEKIQRVPIAYCKYYLRPRRRSGRRATSSESKAGMNFVPQTESFDTALLETTRRRAPINAATFSALAFLLEFGVVLTLALATGVLYHLVAYGSVGSIGFYLQVGALSAAVYAIANTARGDYRRGNFLGGKVHTRRLLVHWHGAFLCLLAAGFLAQLSVIYSRAWIALFYVSGLLLLVPLRRLLTRATLFASRNGIVSAKRIFIVGATPRVSAFLQRYRPSQLGVEVVGCCFLPLLPGRLSEGSAEVLTRELEFALIQAREANPDAIMLLAPWTATDAVKQTAEKFGVLPAELHLGPDGMLEEFTNAELLRLGPISTLQLTSAPLGTLQWLTKRFLDVVLAIVALVLLAPLLTVVAWLVRRDGGPAFFRQRRYGYNQETFWIVKFRTMRVMEDGPELKQATRDDDRVTPLGRWLRRWNIDELPQLVNVIKGDMSLVGPRPHALAHNLEYEKKIRLYARRHNMKPGITGWAQVHGFRGETDETHMGKRVEYDLYYVENCWLDIQILARTVLSRKSYRNAF